MKILIVINDGKFFLSHRLGLAKGAKEHGFEILVACPDSEATQKIIAEGFQFYHIPLHRRSLNPVYDLWLIYQLKKLYRKTKPDCIHHFSIKPILFGTIASWFSKKSIVVNAPTGLGYAFVNTTKKAKFIRGIVLTLYKTALLRNRSCIIFQNPDDRELFKKLGLSKRRETFLVKGAGVDPTFYSLQEESQEQPIVIFPARLLWDKGLQEFVDAAREIKNNGISAKMVLVGDVDPGNPASVTREQLDLWVKQQDIEWWGWQEDMLQIYHKSHIVCLPSYREGIPKALLEAASCGKPIVTTDAPGCREVVKDGENGFLVPVKDFKELAARLTTLIQDASLRHKMGIAGRARVQEEFSTAKIVNQTLEIYHSLQERYTSK